MKPVFKFLFITLFCVSIFTLNSFADSDTDKNPAPGKLKPCPNKPNCVSTQAKSGSEHSIEPMVHKLSSPDAKALIISILNEEERTKQIKNSEFYLHYTFKSRLMGFIDDVEFDFSKEGLVQFRSASQLGYSDMGVNRKRMKRISIKFKNAVRDIEDQAQSLL